jgi:hypothetical protein
LKNVTVIRTTPPSIDYDPFYYVPLSSATLSVPKGSKSAYRSAQCWQNFRKIVERNE